MKTFSVALVLFVAIIFGNKAEMINRKCTAVGLMCMSCDVVKLCTRNGTDFQEEAIGVCVKNNGESCYNGECIRRTNPICTSLSDTFRCQSVGYFPDPYNCQRYHHCIDEHGSIEDRPVDCPDGYAYNARTLNCDKKLPENRCDSLPIPLCSTIGQHGALEDDRSIYFVCKIIETTTLEPILKKCPANQVYDGNYGCF